MRSGNPNPNQSGIEAYKWKKGQTGNPEGHSRRRRVSDALAKLLEQDGAVTSLANVMFAKAAGLTPLLKIEIIDPQTKQKIWITREPDLGWLKELLDRTEGKVETHVLIEPTSDEPRRIEIPDVDDRPEEDETPGRPSETGDASADPPA